MLRVEIVLLLCGLCAFATAGLQSAGARGYLTCNGKPLKDVLVKLYDEDDGGVDDLMAKTKTDAKGYFSLSGSESELFTIDPKLNIYHDCNDAMKPCQRKITIKIPNRYIAVGNFNNKFFEAGTMELSGKYPGEKRDCIH
uniref:Transthyretin-like family protein n=1 Tax=Panagrellus redivivus TaxID=6233 RepID=A0A7E4VFB2_PANRE